MSVSKNIAIRTKSGTAANGLSGVFKELLIRNDAWREYVRLQRLDADDLRDMGLSEENRTSVTLSQIAARMRG